MESYLFLKRRREGEYSSHLLAFKYSNNIKSQTNIADGAIVSTMSLSDQIFRKKHVFNRYLGTLIFLHFHKRYSKCNFTILIQYTKKLKFREEIQIIICFNAICIISQIYQSTGNRINNFIKNSGLV